MIGQSISHYKILEKLGEGGMGVVYKAHDAKLDRFVALKFLPQHLTTNEEEKLRFLQEARAASSLNHANVCTIHAIEEYDLPADSARGVAANAQEGKQQFIVMEYVDGTTLREKLLHGPIGIKDAIAYAVQIAEALLEAHNKGIVHRDIKGDNIMVNAKNQIKVMDFGLAKLKGSLKLTRATSTVGTLGYMAPEQIQGGEADARSDIFSVGVVLYEMLTTHLPFRGEHEAAMMYSIVNEEPIPIQTYVPGISSELTHILGRTLEKDPADRYQTVNDLLIDLRRLKRETTRVSVPLREEMLPARRLSRKALFLVIASVIVIGAAGAAFLLLRGGSEPSGPMVTRLLKIPSSNANMPNISSDGNWIVFVADDARQISNLYMVHASGGEPKKITEDTIYNVKQVPCFSPDASQIVYERIDFSPYHQDLYVVSMLGGTSHRLISNATLPVWSPDGKRIAFFRVNKGYELWTASSDGTNETRLISFELMFFYNVSWSPDSRKLAFLRSFRTPTKERYTEIFVRGLDDSTEHQITHDKKIIDDFCWASTGEIVFNSTRGGDVDLWVIADRGGTATQLTLGAGADRVPRVSKDSKRIVYVNESETSNIWSLDLSTKENRQLTFEDVQALYPVFNGDGTKIVFWRADMFESKQNYYVTCGKDGGDPVRFMPTVDNYNLVGWPPSRWSQDGRSIMFQAIRSDTVRKNPDSIVFHSSFFANDLAANVSRKIFDGQLFDASRDGNYILYRRDGDSIVTRGVLARMTTPGQPIRELISPWAPAMFSSDSKSVIIQDSVSLSFLSIEDGKPKQRVKTPRYFINIAQLPDGRSMLGAIWNPTKRTRTLVKLLLRDGSIEKISETESTSSLYRFGCSLSPDGKTLAYFKSETKNRIVLLDNFR
ncbi:MAG: protein kinase [Bacteroidota bacterium]